MRNLLMPRLFLKSFYLLFLLLTLLQAACSHIPGLRSDPTAELKQFADKGDAGAQLLLAQLLEEGAGLPRDLDAALAWYRKSAAQGDPVACLELARLLLSGKTAAQDGDNYTNLLFKAGKAGNAEAQVQLGSLYAAGRGKEEFAAQVRTAKNGAVKGDVRSQYIYGWILREGAGVPPSASDARIWLKKAARQGSAAAALILGEMTLTGEGAQKDVPAAVWWFEQAAAAGDQTAVAMISLLQSKGIKGTRPIPDVAARQRREFEADYRRLQFEFIEQQSEANPEIALEAARRLLYLDPSDPEANRLAERLQGTAGTVAAPLFTKAEQLLAAGEFRPFAQNLAKLISMNPDKALLRELNFRYWLRIDEPYRKMEKELLADLRLLESFDTPEEIRKNQGRIRKLIADCDETIEKWRREKPDDARLTAVVQRFERITSAINKKLEEQKGELAQPIDPDLIKGVSLLEGGHFDAAGRIFEKLARTPGYRNIAGAYVYLGIASLARINMSKVKEAKILRLKGIASFQNALRFDSRITLPVGYLKFKDVFEEARRFLK